MPTLSVEKPYKSLFDLNGYPLSSGFVYIGTAGSNPETSLINTYWDSALTIPATNPVRTIAGYLSRNGSPGRLYVNAKDFSITVRDKSGGLIFTELYASPIFSSSVIPASIVYVNTLAELKAVTNLYGEISCLGRTSNGDGYEGDFVWIPGDQSAHVSIDPTSGIWVAPDSDPTGSSGAWKRVDDDINIKYLGAVGDGITDDTAALTSFLNNVSNHNGYIIEGTYEITSAISVGLSNCKITGVPGKTKITGSFGYMLLKLLSSNNVVFEDIIFETTYVNAADDAGTGIVHSDNSAQLDDVAFLRCTFTGPSCGCNGLGLYPRIANSGDTGYVRNLTVDHCQFLSLGRMGAIFLNRDTTSERYDAFRGLRFTNNYASGTGLTSIYGMVISMDGFGSDFYVNDNEIHNALDIGIENTGWISGTINGNTFGTFTRVYSPLAFSLYTLGTGPMRELSICNNKIRGAASANCAFIDMEDCYFSGNYFETTGTNAAVLFRSISGCTVVGDIYVNDGTNVALFEAVSYNTEGNKFIGVEFNNSASTTGTAAVRFNGANVKDNRFDHCSIGKGTAGNYADNINSATNNFMFNTIDLATNDNLYHFVLYTNSDADQDISAGVYGIIIPSAMRFNGATTTTRTITMPNVPNGIGIWNDTGNALNMQAVGGGSDSIAYTERRTYYFDGTNGKVF